MIPCRHTCAGSVANRHGNLARTNLQQPRADTGFGATSERVVRAVVSLAPSRPSTGVSRRSPQLVKLPGLRLTAAARVTRRSASLSPRAIQGNCAPFRSGDGTVAASISRSRLKAGDRSLLCPCLAQQSRARSRRSPGPATPACLFAHMDSAFPQGQRHGSSMVFTVAADVSVQRPHSLPLPASNAPACSKDESSAADYAFSPPRVGRARLYVLRQPLRPAFEHHAASGKGCYLPFGVAPYTSCAARRQSLREHWGCRRPGAGESHRDRGPRHDRAALIRKTPRQWKAPSRVPLTDSRDGSRRERIWTGLHSIGLAVSPTAVNGRSGAPTPPPTL